MKSIINSSIVLVFAISLALPTTTSAASFSSIERQLNVLEAQLNAFVQKKPYKQKTTAGEVSSTGLIFFDDLETGDFSKTMNGFKWTDKQRISVVRDDQYVVNNGRTVLTGPIADKRWENTPASTGHHALRFRYEAGQPMTELRYKMGAAYKDIWLSYWIRVPLNFKHLDGPSSDNQKFAAIWMDGYSANGTSVTCTPQLWPTSSKNGGSKMVVSCSALNDATNEREYHDSRQIVDLDFIQYPQDQGRWMHVVQHYKASSARGTKDGVIEIWRRWQDESTHTKFIDDQAALMYLPAAPTPATDGFASGYLMGWANSHYATNTEFLMDDVTFSTTSLLPTGALPTIPFTPNSTTIVTPPVVAPAPTLIFSTTSNSLTWSTTNATACTASGDASFTGTKSRSGTQTVAPTVTTTYTLTCTGTGGSVTKTVTVTVQAPTLTPNPTPTPIPTPIPTTQTPQPSVTISASDRSITPGTSVTLTWSTTNATACTASGGWSGTRSTSGSETVLPQEDTRYTLTCTGAGGTAENRINVSVRAPNTVTPTISTVSSPSKPKSTTNRYQTLAPLKVRSAPGLNAASIGTQQQGIQGTLKESPIIKDGHTWYHLKYDNGTDGWSTGLYLTKVGGTNTTPVATTQSSTKPTNCTVTPKYTKNTKVITKLANVSVRTTPGGTSIGTKQKNAKGTITTDPLCTGTTVWYNVNYITGKDGYTKEKSLQRR